VSKIRSQLDALKAELAKRGAEWGEHDIVACGEVVRGIMNGVPVPDGTRAIIARRAVADAHDLIALYGLAEQSIDGPPDVCKDVEAWRLELRALKDRYEAYRLFAQAIDTDESRGDAVVLLSEVETVTDRIAVLESAEAESKEESAKANRDPVSDLLDKPALRIDEKPHTQDVAQSIAERDGTASRRRAGNGFDEMGRG